MLLRRTCIPYSMKKKFFWCMSGKILFIVDNVYEGFVYRFMNVRAREKMAGKVNRYPDSVFDGLRNWYFIIDFETILKENKRRYVEKHTESCK